MALKRDTECQTSGIQQINLLHDVGPEIHFEAAWMSLLVQQATLKLHRATQYLLNRFYFIFILYFFLPILNMLGNFFVSTNNSNKEPTVSARQKIPKLQQL